MVPAVLEVEVHDHCAEGVFEGYSLAGIVYSTGIGGVPTKVGYFVSKTAVSLASTI
jgi:hypothetical protein